MNRLLVLFCLVASMFGISGLASAGGPKALDAEAMDSHQYAELVHANRSYVVQNAHLIGFQPGEPQPSCSSSGQPSLWFRYKADRAVTITVDTFGSWFPYADPGLSTFRSDTVMTLFELPHYTGSDPVDFSDMGQIDCNDDFAGQRYSQLTFTASPNTWYYIRVAAFKTNALPEGSKIMLTLNVDNLLDTWWQITGPGKPDDVLNCDAECYFNFNHSLLGGSKLLQTIDTFDGVKLSKNSALVLTGQAYLSGADQNFALKLFVTYTDGTVVSKKAKVTSIGPRTSDMVHLETAPLTLTKPVASIKVQFTDKVKTSGFVSLSGLVLAVNPPQAAQSQGGLLPLPQAPK